jgi:hypothetical protein
MHRLEDWPTTFRVAGVEPNYGRQLKKRGQVATAFGPLVAGSVPFDLDAAFIAMHHELGGTLRDEKSGELGTRNLIGRLLSLHWDCILTAVGVADALAPKPVFLVVMQDTKGDWRIAQGVFKGIAEWPPEKVATIKRMFMLNVTATLARLRENASKLGIDLSDPLFPPPGDPLFQQVMVDAEEDREKVRAKVRELLELRQ